MVGFIDPVGTSTDESSYVKDLAQRTIGYGFDSLIVENNYLRVLRFNTQGLSIEGIRIHGYLGRMMIVRQNHLVNVSTGIFVRPLNGGGTPLWLVSYNMIPRSAKQVDAPDRVMKDHNFA